MRPELPPGHYDVESAAELLGMSKLRLYKILREKGILKTDKRNGQKFGQHNHLHPYYIRLGWGYMSASEWRKRGTDESTTYQCGLAVFYQQGFDEIKKIVQEGAEPPRVTMQHIKAVEREPEPTKQEIKNDFKTDLSREACLKHLKEIGL